MESYNYEVVNTDEEIENINSRKYLLRQILVCSAITMFFFMIGLSVGAPTVYIPQMKREKNSSFVVDDSMASWLTSMLSIGSIPWCFLLPISASYFGRKHPHVAISISFVVANLIFYFSSNVTQILIYEILTGPLVASLTTVCVMVLTEYTSPKYRGVILTFKSATSFWGIWVSNCIGTFFHWKYIALSILILSLYPVIIIVFVWTESPYYLASKEKFDECIKAHKWLKGNSKAADEELERILKNRSERNNNLKSIFKIIFRKSFYKPTVLSCCVIFLYTFSGKFVCTAYSIDIIKKMTSSESTAYTGMLILDGVSVFSMYVGTGLSHFIKRRTLFFSATSVGIVSLFALTLYTYLVSSGVIMDNKYLSICLLSLYSIGTCCGPMILSTSLYGELLPVECKVMSMCIVALIDKTTLSIVTKAAPHVIKSFGLYAAFLCFGVISSVILTILYFYMPETKDRTLHEIKDLMLGNATDIKEDTKVCNHLKTNK